MRPIFIALLLFSLPGCGGQTEPVMHSRPAPPGPSYSKNIRYRGVDILIQYPSDSLPLKGDLLLLPGWNYKNTLWCDSTDVCKTAMQKGYRVIAPQMMQSIYATHYFPETRQDLRKYPTLLWLDSALNYLHDSVGLLGMKRYALGLSTGGRGVAMICEKKPYFFHAAAALSGDYNQAAMPKDALCTLVYGPFTQHQERWKEWDNPQADRKNFQTPLYLGHGQMDRVVPVRQTLEFGRAVTEAHPRLSVNLHIDTTAGHNFAYWRSELPAVWQFFEKH
ncbi:MAG: prolyl oligopeptidase family serine peptidase [Bacteroidetes bacterium]|nr:prolyl oligopeptidase family serine peptidase [Bacteroidota bacterium]